MVYGFRRRRFVRRSFRSRGASRATRRPRRFTRGKGRARRYTTIVRSRTVYVNVYDVPFASSSVDFKLNEVPGYAEITALYRQFKFAKVNMKVLWNAQAPLPAAGAPAGEHNPMLFHCWRNPTGTTAPTTQSTVDEINPKFTKMITRAGVIYNTTIRPSALTMFYRTVASTAYTPIRSPWSDTTNTDGTYFGINWALTNLQSAATPGATYFHGTLVFDFKYYIQVKTLK